MQLAGSSCIWHFLSSPYLLRAGWPPPLPAAHGTFPVQHLAFYGMKRWKVTEDRRAARVQSSVPKACPQARPWGVEYCRQPARSSRAGQGAPPFRGSCCTGRLRTRAVGLHWSAQPLQGLQDPTMQGRAEKQQDGAQPGGRGPALPAPRRQLCRPARRTALPCPRRKSQQGQGTLAPLPCQRLAEVQDQEGGSEPGTHPAETRRPAGYLLMLLPAWVRALLWVSPDFNCPLPWLEPFLL